MKATVELPDELFAEAKAVALRRRMSLKTLFTRALERELRGNTVAPRHERFQVDASGWPVLRTAPDDLMVVSDSMINYLREAEGI